MTVVLVQECRECGAWYDRSYESLVHYPPVKTMLVDDYWICGSCPLANRYGTERFFFAVLDREEAWIYDSWLLANGWLHCKTKYHDYWAIDPGVDIRPVLEQFVINK